MRIWDESFLIVGRCSIMLSSNFSSASENWWAQMAKKYLWYYFFLQFFKVTFCQNYRLDFFNQNLCRHLCISRWLKNSRKSGLLPSMRYLKWSFWENMYTVMIFLDCQAYFSSELSAEILPSGCLYMAFKFNKTFGEVFYSALETLVDSVKLRKTEYDFILALHNRVTAKVQGLIVEHTWYVFFLFFLHPCWWKMPRCHWKRLQWASPVGLKRHRMISPRGFWCFQTFFLQLL